MIFDKKQTEMFYATLALIGFGDSNHYQPLGDSGQSLWKDFGTTLYKNGSLANVYSSAFKSENLLPYIPKYCAAYLADGKYTLSIFQKQFSITNELETIEDIKSFVYCEELYTYVLKLQSEAFELASKAIESLEYH